MAVAADELCWRRAVAHHPSAPALHYGHGPAGDEVVWLATSAEVNSSAACFLSVQAFGAAHAVSALDRVPNLWGGGPSRVDSFRPNPWGVYNAHGNIWDSTEDCWNDKNSGNPVTEAPERLGIAITASSEAAPGLIAPTSRVPLLEPTA